MRNYRFYKLEKRWYIDFPEWKGDLWELEMVEGADKMLDKIAGPGRREVFLTMSLKPFTHDEDGMGSYPLVKIKDTPEIGGARYLLKEWYGEELNLEMWLCHVTEFVFGSLPEIIYIG